MNESSKARYIPLLYENEHFQGSILLEMTQEPVREMNIQGSNLFPGLKQTTT